MNWIPLAAVAGAILFFARKASAESSSSPESTSQPQRKQTQPQRKQKMTTDVSSGTFTKEMVNWGDYTPGRKTLALVVGHSRGAQGAEFKYNGKIYTEFNTMLPLAEKIRLLMPTGINTPIFKREKLNQYLSENRYLDSLNPDYILRLHINEFYMNPSGVEVLYKAGDKTGRELAEELSAALASVMKIPNRGPKPRRADENAGHLLWDVKATCVIGENGFISRDLPALLGNFDKVAGVYANVFYNRLKESTNA